MVQQEEEGLVHRCPPGQRGKRSLAATSHTSAARDVTRLPESPRTPQPERGGTCRKRRGGVCQRPVYHWKQQQPLSL
ncbi:hypothetical protein PR048_014719 [Dryococelus australis]|uniref:Uncharacterized protein n=1 Tax=Dryococelus australis TaxID=614101 RepID=A0ABQ9HEZ7_9NEOP|nr:hypothetical protein PR048_014719 [Dryococelus australis]